MDYYCNYANGVQILIKYASDKSVGWKKTGTTASHHIQVNR